MTAWSFVTVKRPKAKVRHRSGPEQATCGLDHHNVGGIFGGNITFLGLDAGNLTMTGCCNSGLGYRALASNTSGSFNIAVGGRALADNTTGFTNTAIGESALFRNTTGVQNTASGFEALRDNTTGSNNTASGFGALQNNTTGNGNTAIGTVAGAVTTGSDNICIANTGVAGESNTTRIGQVQTRTFIAGIRGVTTGQADAIPVLIDSTGQLGTASSSARFKEEIEEMGQASSALLKLRPVTFRYKTQPGDPRHFGLIAEEVEEILPELVVHTPDGQAETVLYHEMPAMLLNELQKQYKLNFEQQKRIEALQARLAALEGSARETHASVR